MEPLIRVQDLHKIYNPGENEVRALDGITLEIERGEFVAIVGHSGSGKSTLMNMLGCLDIPTTGNYFLDGQDVSRLSDNQLSDIRNKKIGFIFQGFNLIPNLDALGNVELPLIYRGMGRQQRRKAAVEALERVGLKKRMKHKPGELSGGQQQRVAVARAVAAQPPIILADEPTGNLDSHSTVDIMNILKGLHQSGRTVIIITHDDDIAEQAHRVVRIMDGRIEADYLNSEKNTDSEEIVDKETNIDSEREDI
ncbi:MAG TPA: ABC transporter ATP-binding protein [Candidatus Mediterraneibacter merdavium]|nr:ABC transporter ATP-binding protein [Candidatus Mediterraneibacter merdavium]